MRTFTRRSRLIQLVGVVVAAVLALSLGAAGTHAVDRRIDITADTRLDYDRLGPIRIGMTLAEARRASGQALPYTDSIATRDCGWAKVEPRSVGAALGIANGVVEAIQLRGSATLRVRGGARIGDSLHTLRRRYGAHLRRDHPNPYVRTLTRGAYRIVFAVDEGNPVEVITAGRRPAIDFNSLCT